MQTDSGISIDPGNAIDFDALSSWMTDQSLGAGPIEKPQLLAGGTQNILLGFRRDTRDYVLRRPPVHLRDNSNETMLREARVLKALAGSKVPHPGFIAVCDDESVLGCCFYLMEPVDGFNATNGLLDYHRSDPAIRHRMGLSLVEAVAALGAVDYQSVGLANFGKPEGFLERQVSRWMAQMEAYGELDGWPGASTLPGFKETSRWLEANRPADYQPGIMHGDYHIANVMYHNDSAEIAAIVDWELCTIGDPLLDLGWLLATWYDPAENVPPMVEPWEGFPTANELIAHYAERSSRNMDSVCWYGVLACFKLAVLLEGTHARACAGKAPKDLGDQLHVSSIRLFERATRMFEKWD